MRDGLSDEPLLAAAARFFREIDPVAHNTNAANVGRGNGKTDDAREVLSGG